MDIEALVREKAQAAKEASRLLAVMKPEDKNRTLYAMADMLEKRNLSAHTYNEQTAQVIYAAVKGKYFAMLAAFDEDVAARLGEDER